MITESLSASGRWCSVAGTVSASRWILVTYSPVYSSEPVSTSVCSGLGHLLRWEELPIPVRLLMQVSSHFRGPPSPGFNSWKTDFLLCCSSLLREPRKNSFSIWVWYQKLGGQTAVSVCIHICMCIFYAYGTALPCSLGFISTMNVSGISNPYQSVMPSLSLHFQFLFLLKVFCCVVWCVPGLPLVGTLQVHGR